MSTLWMRIRAAIAAGDYVIGVHAAIRLRQRRIPIWQVVAASLEGKLMVERPKSRPNPVVELEIILPRWRGGEGRVGMARSGFDR